MAKKMIISLKHEIGDKVFFMQDDCFNEGEVLSSAVDVNADGTKHIEYEVEYFDPNDDELLRISIKEEKVHRTIYELTEQLTKDYEQRKRAPEPNDS